MRESPAIPVIQALQAEGAGIQAFDPVACREAAKVFGHDHITYHHELESALDGVDAILVLTRWDEFKQLPRLLDGKPVQPLVVDGRRMLDKTSVSRYAGIGYRENHP
jgi:UDPglucose 6-dehydrogenase/GDP-mannose 6-dehydrogenase